MWIPLDDESIIENEEDQFSNVIDLLPENTSSFNDVTSDLDNDENDVENKYEKLSNWQKIKDQLQFKNGLHCAYVLLGLVVVGSVVAWIIIMDQVLVPFIKTSHFKSTICHVTNVTYLSAPIKCSCGKGCSSFYSCVIIHVDYSVQSSVNQSAHLHQNQMQLNQKCSYYPTCKPSQIANLNAVRKFAYSYGQIGKEFSCFYNQAQHIEQVVLKLLNNSYQVIHGVVWSTFVLLSTICIVVCVIRSKKSK